MAMMAGRLRVLMRVLMRVPMLVLTALLTGWAGLAVAAVPDARPYASPEVHADGTVTFRILAPEARTVTIEGGWLPPKQTVPLARDDKGLWSVTIGPLKPTVYAYWFNLDGAVVLDQANRFIRERVGGSSTSAVDVPGPNLAWALRDVPHGTIERHLLPAKAFGGETRALEIYLPPGYAQHPEQRYPVLYLFHGQGEFERSWVDSGKANLILDNLIADGRAVPMLVVMPYTGPSVTAAAPVLGKDGPPLPVAGMAYVTREVIPWTQANLRVLPGRDHRAIAGLSAGGVLASALAFTFPDLTRQLGMFSAPMPVHNPDFPPVDAHLALFWIGVGSADPGIATRLRDFDRELTARGIHHSFAEHEGAHDYAVWRWAFGQFAPLLFR